MRNMCKHTHTHTHTHTHSHTHTHTIGLGKDSEPMSPFVIDFTTLERVHEYT